MFRRRGRRNRTLHRQPQQNSAAIYLDGQGIGHQRGCKKNQYFTHCLTHYTNNTLFRSQSQEFALEPLRSGNLCAPQSTIVLIYQYNTLKC
jgi:hypothetical protein